MMPEKTAYEYAVKGSPFFLLPFIRCGELMEQAKNKPLDPESIGELRAQYEMTSPFTRSPAYDRADRPFARLLEEVRTYLDSCR